DPQHVGHVCGSNTSTGAQTTGVRIGRRDIGIGAMIEVKEGALGPLEYNVIAAPHCLTHHTVRIVDKSLQSLPVTGVLLAYRLQVNHGEVEKMLEKKVVLLQVGLHGGAKLVRLDEILHAQAAACCLVGIGRAN